MSARRTFISMLAGGGGGGTGEPADTFLVVYDAAVGVTTSGATLTGWANNGTAGSSCDLNSITNTPTLVASIINGLPVVRFAGSDQLARSGALSEPGDLTMYAVSCRSGTLANAHQLGLSAASAQANLGTGSSGATNRIGGFFDTVNSANSNTFYELSNVFEIVAAVRSSGTITFYKNSRAVAPTASSTPGSGTCQITVGFNWIGDIAETGITNTALNSTDLATMFSQLATKYALTLYAGGTTGTAISRSGWTVTASASGGGATSNAVDSNTATRWATGAQIVPGTDFFKVDLGSAATVGGVQLDNTSFTGDTPTSGDVQYSDDNSSWTTAASWQFTLSPLPVFSMSWTPVSHRYWRLLAQGTANGASTNWWSIGEINLYSDSAP